MKIDGNHKNIVLFYGVTDLNETPSLVLSYESERSLKQYLRLWENKNVTKVVEIFEEIISGIT